MDKLKTNNEEATNKTKKTRLENGSHNKRLREKIKVNGETQPGQVKVWYVFSYIVFTLLLYNNLKRNVERALMQQNKTKQASKNNKKWKKRHHHHPPHTHTHKPKNPTKQEKKTTHK